MTLRWRCPISYFNHNAWTNCFPNQPIMRSFCLLYSMNLMQVGPTKSSFSFPHSLRTLSYMRRWDENNGPAEWTPNQHSSCISSIYLYNSWDEIVHFIFSPITRQCKGPSQNEIFPSPAKEARASLYKQSGLLSYGLIEHLETIEGGNGFIIAKCWWRFGEERGALWRELVTREKYSDKNMGWEPRGSRYKMALLGMEGHIRIGKSLQPSRKSTRKKWTCFLIGDKKGRFVSAEMDE